MAAQGTDVVERLEAVPFEELVPEWFLQVPEEEFRRVNRKIRLRVHVLPDGEFETIEVRLSDTLREVMGVAADKLRVTLYPPAPLEPFDRLFCYGRQNQLIGPLTDLSMPLLRALREHRCQRKFALELVLSIKVNATWKVATKSAMTPREILALFEMDHTQFTLYPPDSQEPLPLDTPLKLERGQCFEALKDGRYGAV